MDASDLNGLKADLASKIPIWKKVGFSEGDEVRPQRLPPAVTLFSLMTDPRIPGDTCALLPVKERLAASTAVLTAISEMAEKFPELQKRYLTDEFEIGERVRVLPTGHVYLFDGYLEYNGERFFRLKVLDDNTQSSRSFPIKEAIRLEKTNRLRPKGKGDTPLGAFQRSKLDFVIGTETGGNAALMANQVVLVTARKNFEEFIEAVHISPLDASGHRFPLSDVIPWGTVNSAGEIEFSNSAAASGEPLIAVSPRAEYVAEFCRRNNRSEPRVIVDGASRLKDLQALDDIVDHSKLLIIADHAEAKLLGEISRHDCLVWKMPNDFEYLAQGETGILQSFSRACQRAAHFEINRIACESPVFDQYARDLVEAESLIEENENDDPVKRLVSIAFARLLDLSSLVCEADDDFGRFISESIEGALSNLQLQKLWLPTEAYNLLKTVFEGLLENAASNGATPWDFKQLELYELLLRLVERDTDVTVLGANNFAAASARRFLGENELDQVRVMTLAEFLTNPVGDDAVLTGWPKIRNLERICGAYPASRIWALAYSFEEKWFAGAEHRRRRNLMRWETGAERLAEISGVKLEVIPEHKDVDNKPDDHDLGADQVFEFERRLARVRKGSRPGSLEDVEPRIARYVGFVGSTYSYLTETHSVPVVTGLLREGQHKTERVPVVTVDDLSMGDLVLFRVQADSDKDMIRFIAEQLFEPGEYQKIREKAESWKECLRGIATEPKDIAWKLQQAGLNKSDQAVRFWLSDPNRIGPGDQEDLKFIAEVSGVSVLRNRITEIWEAIQTVRGAHTSAGSKLSQMLIKQLPQQVPELNEAETIVELAIEDITIGSVAIVEVEAIAEETEPRSPSEVNRLLREQE